MSVLGDPGNWREAIASALGEAPAPTPTPAAPTLPPSYESIFYGVPGFAAGIGSVQANEDAAARQRAAAIKAALVQFGAAPSGWASGYGDADQATLDAAGQNPFSTLRTLTDAQGHSQADLDALLADRGTLSSGALTGGNQLIQRNYDRSAYDATNALLASLGGYEGAYAKSFNDLESQRAGLIGNAAQTTALNPDLLGAVPQVPQAPRTYDDLGAQAQPITSDLVKPPAINGAVVRPPIVAPPRRRRRVSAAVPSSIGAYIR